MAITSSMIVVAVHHFAVQEPSFICLAVQLLVWSSFQRHVSCRAGHRLSSGLCRISGILRTSASTSPLCDSTPIRAKRRLPSSKCRSRFQARQNKRSGSSGKLPLTRALRNDPNMARRRRRVRGLIGGVSLGNVVVAVRPMVNQNKRAANVSNTNAVLMLNHYCCFDNPTQNNDCL